MIRGLILSLSLCAVCMVSGCATVPGALLEYRTGAVADTLYTSFSFSVSKGQHGMSANGYLMYQRPDRMRMVILTPFNTKMMDAFILGDSITIAYSSEGVAFSGRYNELPELDEGNTWRLARWVMDMEPSSSVFHNGTIERTNRIGGLERVTYENGLIVSKSLANGDTASYSDYIVMNGIPLATLIIIHSHDETRYRLVISEPEVNAVLTDDVFTPQLDGLKLFPLAALRKQ